MFLCVSGTSQKFGAWGPNRSWDIDLPSSMYLLNLTQCLDTSIPPMGVSTPPKWSWNVLMCLRNLPKNLVHGTLIEAEILTSPLPNVVAHLSPVFGTGTPPMDVSAPPKWSRNVSMCLRNLQKQFGEWDPNRSWDFDLPTPPCICWTWPSVWALAFCPQVCQHLPSTLKMFLCVSGTSKKMCCMHTQWEVNTTQFQRWWHLTNRGSCVGT